MDRPLHYDIRDILIAPARALSAKRIFVMTLFLLLSLGIYDLFTYLAVAIEGDSIGAFWSVFGLLPVVWLPVSAPAAQAVYGVGVVIALIGLMLGFFAVSAIEIEQIRGNRFLPMRGAIKFAFRRLPQVALGQLAIGIFLVFLFALYLLLGLIVRIPVVGEWIYALTFVLPVFIVALFTVFIFAVFQVAVVLLPAAAAADRRGETFTAILETFSTVIRQPVRWLVYTAYGLVAAKAASWVYAYACYRAVQFSAWAVSITAGEEARDLVREGLSHLPVQTEVVEQTMQLWPGVDWGVAVWPWVMRDDNPASYVMGAMLFIVFASIIGYFLAVVATTQARGYVLMRYFKDEYKIAAEKPLFFDEAQTVAQAAAVPDQQ